ncbi:MAG: tetraacyldisaccharide 4'-kinase [Chitinophagaceae bacterium]|nr:tetraacyldisaccharide 4'-kinase [Chitinophagaceae bacterium]
MSFNFYLFRGIRFLLLPVSILAGLYIRLRNLFYDKGLLKSIEFNLPVICIGNLSVGGTGKSPMTEYILDLLSKRYETAVLSRGYKRKTSGYLLANEGTTALEIGDEPMQFYKKFPHVAVAVGEERIEAIPQLLHDRPDTKVILLDDAFQHRAIRAGFNIILTDFSNPYWHDTYLPTGDLRDNRSSAARADIIIVTKCPEDLGSGKKQEMLKAIKPQKHQKVFFTSIEYGFPYHISNRQHITLQKEQEVLLVCGIANPLPLKNYLEQHVDSYFEKNYNDHHIFSIDDFKDIVEKFNSLDAAQKIILTTEKDAVRFEKFKELLEGVPMYVIPIRHRFLFEEGAHFEMAVLNFLQNFPNAAATD